MDIKEFLQKAQENKKIPTSTLLVSKKDITDLAMPFAKGILCQNGVPWGCGSCHSCSIFYEKHPDFIWIGKEGIKINDIRVASDFFVLRPNYSNSKVCLISNIQTMQKEAANALLKTLEEPPVYMKFILTADSISNIIPTILSRSFVLEVFDIIKIKNPLCDKLLSKEFYESIPAIDNLKDPVQKEELIECIISKLQSHMLKSGFDQDIELAIKSLNTIKRAIPRGIRLSLHVLTMIDPIISKVGLS